MRYLAAHFNIACDSDMLQTARDLLTDLAGEAGFESFEDTPVGTDGYVQQQLLDQTLLDEQIGHFPIDGIGISYSIEPVEDQDWNATWEESGFEPIDIDGRVIVYDAKGNRPGAPADAIMIGIDARQAFGTGTHETTQMIISTLLSMPMAGKSTLDCGCGTGILSIAAARLGATRCVGYDIDEWSVDNAKHNAQINGAELTVLLGDAAVTEQIEGTFDVVMANINRNILLADMPMMVNKMNGNGTLILSGFYPADIDQLCDRAAQLGLREVGRKTRGDWACLVLAL